MTCLLPVTVMKISPKGAASAIGRTRKPSITASIAFVGSISVTITLPPMPLARRALPLPHQPYPATTMVFPANKMLVARMMPSKVDCPVP